MNKASERYNTKVEIPISVILETIFSDDNHDVETLCRWAKHYEFVDLVKENENDKLGYYKLQDDYTKQSFYVLLDKEERKQYDYEDYLLDELEEKDKEIERLNNIIKELEKYTIEQRNIAKDNLEIIGNEGKRMATRFVVYNEYLDKLKALKGGTNER